LLKWFFLSGGREIEVRHDQNHVTTRQGGDNNNIHKLTIKNLSYTEIANFTCKAENEVGFNRGHIEITGIPQRPSIVSDQDSLFHNQYNLIFTVKSHEPLVQVLLRYKQQGSNRFMDDLTNNYIERRFTPGNLKTNELRPPKIISRVISYEIDHLNRSCSYSLLVSVRNKHGWSDQSNMFTFRTRNQDYKENRQKSFFDFQSSSRRFGYDVAILGVMLSVYLCRLFYY